MMTFFTLHLISFFNVWSFLFLINLSTMILSCLTDTENANCFHSEKKSEVKWALGSITANKARGGDGIPVELFQITKDNAEKVLHLICQQHWKTQQWPQDWKRSVFIPIPKKANTKECSNYCTIVLISHEFDVMLAR